jgi:hypothetical protein
MALTVAENAILEARFEDASEEVSRLVDRPILADTDVHISGKCCHGSNGPGGTYVIFRNERIPPEENGNIVKK